MHSWKDGEWLDLPLGHYGREDAETLIHSEYSEAHKIQKKWRKKSKKWPRFASPEIAVAYLNRLAYSLGEPKPIVRRIVLDSTEVGRVASAHYSRKGKEIHFKTSWMDFGMLIHEAAHYWAHNHKQGFCEILDLLFEAALKEV